MDGGPVLRAVHGLAQQHPGERVGDPALAGQNVEVPEDFVGQVLAGQADPQIGALDAETVVAGRVASEQVAQRRRRPLG